MGARQTKWGKGLISLTALATGAGGFVGLFIFVDQLGADWMLFGISDETLRPLGHFAVFGILALLIARGLGGRYVLAWLIGVTLAGLEELNQMRVPSRYAAFDDWLLSAAGVTACILLGWFCHRTFRYMMERRRYRRLLAAEGQMSFSHSILTRPILSVASRWWTFILPKTA